MKRLKIVQVGIGHDHATGAWSTINHLTDLFEVIGWCPVEDEGSREIASKYDAARKLTLEEIEAIPDLDAVVVETDDWNLTKYARIFAERGLAIQMDKPGGLDTEEFEALARTVKKNKCPFQLGYMYRFNPMIMDIVHAANRGDYGPISAVELQMDCEHTKDKRDWLAHFPGGMLYFLGCHLIDLIVQIKGLPDEILPLSYRSGYGDAAGEDVGLTVFKYPNCVAFAKTSGVEAGGFMRRQLIVTGSERTIELRPLEEYAVSEPGLFTRKRDCANGQGWTYNGEHSASKPQDRYEDMFASFAAIARGEKVNPYSLEYECRLHRVLLAACGIHIDYKAPIVL